ncbi:MAG: hypothetical protein ABIZ91_14780 [Gemmatimonadaceae bacterium]
MRWTSLLVVLTAPCAACASLATQANVVRSTTSLGTHSTSAVRRVFTSRLAALGETDAGVQPQVASHAWGTVKLVRNDDDTFEYLITIYNPRGETFRAAHICRDVGGGGAPVLATLFDELTLRERYVQMRGTVSLGRDTRAGMLGEELQEHPGSFLVEVETVGGTPLIRGTVE